MNQSLPTSFRFPKDMIAYGIEIRKQLTRTGRGEFNKFLVDAYFEKWQVELDNNSFTHKDKQ